MPDDYLDQSPWGIEPRCGSCVMFREVPGKFLGHCSKVEGDISPRGWCRFFLDPDQDEDTAYHEAGHAVAAFALKVPVRQATIVPDGDILGHVRHSKLGGAGRNPRRAERRVIIALAGDIAERHHNPHRRRGDARDLGKAIDIIDRLARSDDHLKKWFHRKKWLAELEKEAADLILSDRWWPTVEAVAKALVQRRTLTGKEVASIVAGTSSAKPQLWANFSARR